MFSIYSYDIYERDRIRREKVAPTGNATRN